MNNHRLRIAQIIIIASLQYVAVSGAAGIMFQNVPDAGIQPVLVQDQSGDIHLLYFKEQGGEDSRGHFYYSKYNEIDKSWSAAVQVSTYPYYRPHLIARASMAVGGDLRIHVTWHQDNPVEGYPTDNSSEYLPDILYTHSAKNNSGFEPERALVKKFISDTESGAALAVYGDEVSLVWHGMDPETTSGLESERTVYQILSRDRGATFGAEQLIGDETLGACGCCGLAAAYDRSGSLQVAYRTAIGNEGRHTQLLQMNPGTVSKTTLIHPWQLSACPVSTNDVTPDADGNNHLVFETMGTIYKVDLGAGVPDVRMVHEPESKLLQKHPASAINGQGEQLIVWNEGYGVNGGGSLRWQLFNTGGEPVDTGLEERKVSEHSAAAAAALRDGSFLVIY